MMARPASDGAFDPYGGGTASAGGSADWSTAGADVSSVRRTSWRDRISRGLPSTLSVRSPALRSEIGIPSRPTAMMSTATRSTPARKTGACWAPVETDEATAIARTAVARRIVGIICGSGARVLRCSGAQVLRCSGARVLGRRWELAGCGRRVMSSYYPFDFSCRPESCRSSPLFDTVKWDTLGFPWPDLCTPPVGGEAVSGTHSLADGGSIQGGSDETCAGQLGNPRQSGVSEPASECRTEHCRKHRRGLPPQLAWGFQAVSQYRARIAW